MKTRYQIYYEAHKKECNAASNRWRKAHPEQFAAIQRRWRTKLRLEVLTHYSGGEPRCARCGFLDIRALSIDHVHGGGSKHWRELLKAHTTLYSWLKKNNYPEGFQVLCMNCQWIKKYENNEVPKSKC